MSRASFLKLAIVTAPFTLLLGRAAQAFGLYVFMVLVPYFLIGLRRTNNIFHFSRIGWALVAIYMVFPLFDALALIQGFEPTEEAWKGAHGWSFVLRSQFSSAIGIVSQLIALSPFLLSARSSQLQTVKSDQLMQWWMIGAIVANVVLLVVVVAQFSTGWNMSAAASYRPDRLMTNGFYRAAGACDHPIPFAGSVLAQFGLYLYLATSNANLPPWQKWGSAAIAAISLVCILLSGSRFALLVAALALVWPVWKLAKTARLRVIALAALLVAGMAFVKAAGMWDRFAELSLSSFDSLLGGRAKLWQANWELWQQSKAFGHGGAWLTHQIRKGWYEQLGMPEFSGAYNSHSLILEVLTSAGFIGAILVAIFAVIFVRHWRKIYHTKQGIWAQGLMFALGLNLIHGITQTTYFDTPVAMMLVYPLLLLFWEDQMSARTAVEESA